MKKKVLIIGGVAGGATTAARLRRLNEDLEIILFEKGEYISFANCGLPYHIGGTIEKREKLLLQTPASMNRRFNIDVRVNSIVTSIDRENKKVHVSGPSGEYEENYDYLVISTGSTPIKPPIEGINSEGIFTLWNMPDMDRIIEYIGKNKPKKAVVVGGGFIGLEMVENLVDRNIDVTLVELSNQVMAPLDFEMAQFVHKELSSKGVTLELEKGVSSFAKKGNNIEITLNTGEIIETELVILSIGIRPNNELAVKSGLKTGERGGVVTNEFMQTEDESVFVIGDVAEVVDFVSGRKTMIPLAAPANKQGRIAADNIDALLRGEKPYSTYDGGLGTAVAKVFDLTVATVGLNEKILNRYGMDYQKTVIMPASHATYYSGAKNMTLKVIFDGKGKVLGAQNVGYVGVEKRIDVIATAMHFGGTIDDLKRLELSYAPPYSSAKDPVNMLGFVGENIMFGTVKTINWDEIASLSPETQLVDVRTAMEHSQGFIKGSVNIPVDEIRERAGELDKSRPVVVYCAVGMRGNTATKVLKGLGFDVRNLTGGYNLYSTAMAKYGKK